jgi:hypothetical protein
VNFNIITIYKLYLQIVNNNIIQQQLPYTTDAKELVSTMGISDAGLLLDLAITWSNFINLSEVQYFTVSYWSPGISLIEVPMIWLQSFGIPIYLSMYLFTLALWNLVIYLQFQIFANGWPIVISGILLILFTFSYDHYWIFEAGLFYTEGIGYGLLYLALLLTIKNLRSSHKTKLFFIGLVLGSAILVRYTNEFALLLVTLICIVIILINKIYKSLKNPVELELRNVLLIFAIGLLITVPWRVVNHEFYSMPTWKLSIASNELGYMIWAVEGSDSENYWGETGSNWACRIDQIKCETLNESNIRLISNQVLIREAIISAISNPIQYSKQRLKYGGLFYFNDKSISNMIYSYALLILGLLSFLSIWKTKSIKLYLLILFPFVIINLFYLSLIHFETRYFLPLKILIILTFSLTNLKKSNHSDVIKASFN